MNTAPSLYGEETPPTVENMQEQLEASEKELLIAQEFIRKAPAALIAIDLHTQLICLWNKAAEKVFGYKEEDAIGQPLSIIIPADVISMIDHMDKVSNYAESDRDQIGMGGVREFKALKKDGNLVDIDIKLFKLDIRDVMMIGAVAEDVSELRSLVRKLKQTNSQYELANAELETLRSRIEEQYKAESAARVEAQSLARDAKQRNIQLLKAKSESDRANKLLNQRGLVIGGLIITLLLLTIGLVLVEAAFGRIDDDLKQLCRDIAIALSTVVGAAILQGLFGVNKDDQSKQSIDNVENQYVGEPIAIESTKETSTSYDEFPTTYPQRVPQQADELSEI